MSDEEQRRLNRDELAQLVGEALALIEEDAPGYVVPLHALHALPSEQLEAEADLVAPLFIELRKLRPFPLWVRDTPARALKLKQLGKLDGAIGVGAVVSAEGRECWLEVAATHAEQALRTLPTGWALLVRGERAPWATLRKMSPLRAYGLALDGEPVPHGPHVLPAPLDLVTLDPTRVDEAGLGARVLWSVHSADLRDLADQALALTEQVPFSGLICAGESALACALWFATVRRGRPSQLA
ncbi:MAG TPA: hypothetical protein VFX59_19525 [Polyangiales bacterium]|nr:hypothetical protein [Polyangiales bacterium]